MTEEKMATSQNHSLFGTTSAPLFGQQDTVSLATSLYH